MAATHSVDGGPAPKARTGRIVLVVVAAVVAAAVVVGGTVAVLRARISGSSSTSPRPAAMAPPSSASVTPVWSGALNGATQIFMTSSPDRKWAIVAGPNDDTSPVGLISAETGQLVWVASQRDERGWFGDLVLLTDEKGTTQAVTTQATDGAPTTAWTLPAAAPCSGSTSADVLFVCTKGTVSGVARDGSTSWALDLAGAGIAADDLRTYLVDEGRTLAVYGYGTPDLWLVDAVSGTPTRVTASGNISQPFDGQPGMLLQTDAGTWYYPSGSSSSTWSTPMRAASAGGGYAVGYTVQTGDAAVLSTEDGRSTWTGNLTQSSNSYYYGSWVGHDSLCVRALSSGEPRTVVIEPGTGQQLWSSAGRVGPGTWSGAAVLVDLTSGAVSVLDPSSGRVIGTGQVGSGELNESKVLDGGLVVTGGRSDGSLTTVRLTG